MRCLANQRHPRSDTASFCVTLQVNKCWGLKLGYSYTHQFVPGEVNVPLVWYRKKLGPWRQAAGAMEPVFLRLWGPWTVQGDLYVSLEEVERCLLQEDLSG